jgi:stage V sporulation protein B
MFVSSSFLWISVILKVVLNYFLIRNPGINIYGAVISSYVAYIVPVVLNNFFIKRVEGIKFSVTKCLLCPVVASTVMSVSSYALYRLLYWVVGLLIKGYFGCLIAFVPTVIFAVFVYYLMLRKLGGLTDDDISQISPKLLRLLKKIKLA